MKTILFLAVLLFAAQSSPLHEIYRGFILNLPMKTEAQNQLLNSGFDCLDNFEGVVINLIGSLQKDIPAKNYFDILRNLLVADDVLEHNIVPQCLVVYQELVQFFNQSRIVSPKPNHLDYCKVRKNFSNADEESKYYNECLDAFAQVYYPYISEGNLITAKIIETSANLIHDILYQQVSAVGVGEKLAYALKVANRMVKIDYQIVKRGYPTVPLDRQRFLHLFLAGLFEELGLIDDKTQTLLCVADVLNTTGIAFSNPNLSRGDSLTATHAFLEGALQITDSVQRCSKHFDLSRVSRFVEIFTRDPVKTIGKVFSNRFLNFTDYVAFNTNYENLIHQGAYSRAGKEYAKLIKISLKDLVF